MKPVEFDEQNSVLGKPANMTDEECVSLPCFKDGVNVVSKWELTEDELAEIQKTKSIYVTVLSGPTSPPIKPEVFSPFKGFDTDSLIKRIEINQEVFRSRKAL